MSNAAEIFTINRADLVLKLFEFFRRRLLVHFVRRDEPGRFSNSGLYISNSVKSWRKSSHGSRLSVPPCRS